MMSKNENHADANFRSGSQLRNISSSLSATIERVAEHMTGKEMLECQRALRTMDEISDSLMAQWQEAPRV